MGGRLILFDLDDTLVDHTGAVRAALRALRADHPALGRRPLSAMVLEYNRLLETAHPRIVRGQLSAEVARVARFRSLFDWAGVPASGAAIQGAIRCYRGAYRAARRRLPGVDAVLRSLRPQATLGVLSNNLAREQAVKIEATGLRPLLDFVLTSEELPWAKPDGRAFAAAVARGGVRPHEATMVGDSWSTDIVGARAAGLGTVWLNRFHAPVPSGASGVAVLPGFVPVRRAVGTILGATPRAGGAHSS